MNRDLLNRTDSARLMGPAIYEADATGDAKVDLRGVDSALVEVSTGAIVGDAAAAKVVLQHSLTTDNADFEDVEDGDILGEMPDGLAASTQYRFGYRGPRRYVRGRLVKGAATSIAMCAVVVRGDLHRTA